MFGCEMHELCRSNTTMFLCAYNIDSLVFCPHDHGFVLLTCYQAVVACVVVFETTEKLFQ